MSVGNLIALTGEVASLAGVIMSVIVYSAKIVRGQKCLLRSEILTIYYRCRDAKEISQYEFENVVMLYEAYKNLKGNSFIDKVFEEIRTWKVVQ